MGSQSIKRKFQIIPIAVKGAGTLNQVATTTENSHDRVTGLALFKLGGAHGHGTLHLKIAGQEIFPQGFHADLLTLKADDKNLVLKDVIWPVDIEAKGSSIQLEYKEPEGGEAGKLWLYLFTTEETGTSDLDTEGGN